MTGILIALAVKSALVLALGCVAAWICRRRSAAARHLVWLFTLAAALAMPAGLLIPERAAPRIRVMEAQPAKPQTAAEVRGPSTGPGVLVVLWGVGFAVLVARLAASIWRTRRLVRQSRSIHRADVALDLRVVDGIAAPAAWSFGPGVVVLPRSAGLWTREQLRAALGHETAHLERKDCWALLAAELACALYWFNPLVWYAAARLRAEQEHAADDSVLQQGLAPVEYAAQLVSIASQLHAEPLLAGVGAHSHLAGRVQAILDGKRRRAMLSRRMFLAGAAVALFVTLPLAALQAERRVYSVKKDQVTPPQLIDKVEPKYTPEAKAAKIEGAVVLEIIIEADGSVSSAKVEKSLDPSLDNNAVEAIRAWKFEPAKKDGKPVASRCKVEVNFKLR